MRTFTLIIILAIIIPATASGAVMLLWNCIMPQISGADFISFWQAAGLFLLSQILSGGIIVGPVLFIAGLHAIRHHGNMAEHKRWRHMTDEQRREFVNRWRQMHFERDTFRQHENKNAKQS